MAKCANRDCGVGLVVANRSHDNPSWCAECGDLVWAFRPNQELPDDWFALSAVGRSLPVEGEVVDGDQCDGCGLSQYLIERRSKWTWVAVCAGQVWDGERMEGCGAEHPVRQRKACEVIF